MTLVSIRVTWMDPLSQVCVCWEGGFVTFYLAARKWFLFSWDIEEEPSGPRDVSFPPRFV